MDKSDQTKKFSCAKAFRWKLIVCIAAVIGWSYYAYVLVFCYGAIESTVDRVLLLVIYHLAFVLFLWSYARTIFTPVPTIPAEWQVTHSSNPVTQAQLLESAVRLLPVVNRNRGGSIRFCYTCQVLKPDRAHHCCACGVCVLKMDHHCVWINNCVHFANYKYFLLFLWYALLYCMFIAATTLPFIIRFWRHESENETRPYHMLFMFMLSITFSVLVMTLFSYHIYLVLMNRTTLEANFPPVFLNGLADENGFSLGKFENFKEVFGNNWTLWLLPVYTSRGNGLQYRTQNQHHLPTYNSMAETETVIDITSSDNLLKTTTA